MGAHDIASPSLKHAVLEAAIGREPEEQEEVAIFALGCFWGAERAFWRLPGVVSTAVGYTAGHTERPTYGQVCSGMTGHTEAVRVVYRPRDVTYDQLLRIFWESHDPTQGNRQGNDVGTQYRSGIYATNKDQMAEALSSKETYERALSEHERGPITTEIQPASEFYLAEEYHQQYLHKNPGGYCGLGGCGVSFPSD